MQLTFTARRAFLAAALIHLLCPGFAGAQDRWDLADSNVVRLSPSEFPELPTEVRGDLEKRGCTIPQPWPDVEFRNVITGRFHTADETEWAVLCSVDRVSTILVYRQEGVDRVDSLGTASDKGYLQGVGGRIGFSRAIGAVDSVFIREMYEGFGGPIPPPMAHEGLNDAFLGKASGVYYWYQGEWLGLQGMD